MWKQKRSSGSVRCRRCRRCAAWSTCCAPECCFQEQQSCADNTRKTFQVLIKSANVNWRRTSGAFLDTFKTTTTITTNSLYQEFEKLLFPDEWVTVYRLHSASKHVFKCTEFTLLWVFIMRYMIYDFWKCCKKYHCCCCCACLCFLLLSFIFLVL